MEPDRVKRVEFGSGDRDYRQGAGWGPSSQSAELRRGRRSWKQGILNATHIFTALVSALTGSDPSVPTHFQLRVSYSTKTKTDYRQHPKNPDPPLKPIPFTSYLSTKWIST